MIVVAIVGILAAVALPAYQAYATRARMSEVIVAAGACRSAVSEGYAAGKALPAPNAWGCESTSPSKYVAKVETDALGVITVTTSHATDLPSRAKGRTVTLTPMFPEESTSSSGGPSSSGQGKGLVKAAAKFAGGGSSGSSTGSSVTPVAGTQVISFLCESGGSDPLDPQYLPSTCR